MHDSLVLPILAFGLQFVIGCIVIGVAINQGLADVARAIRGRSDAH